MTLKKACAVVLVLAGFVGMNAAALADTYVYYPSDEVYFEPKVKTWFWSDDTGWHSGTVLPKTYTLVESRQHVNVLVESERPYDEHTTIVKKYGGKKTKTIIKEYHD